MRRKTTEVKKLNGTHRANRDRKTPQFASGSISCPKYLSKTARAEWNRVAPLLEEAGILQEIDASILASYCQMFGHWRSSEDDIARNGLVITVSSQTRTGKSEKPIQNPAVRNAIQFHKSMIQTAVKLGISLLDRQRIEVPPDPDEEDALQRFINASDDDIL